jgi:aminobenzoyl-glutamate transport protein
MLKKKIKLSPIMTFIILTLIVIVLSGFLSLFGVQAEYSAINTTTNEFTNKVETIENLFTSEGLKHIITNAVNDFVNFPPLSMLIVILIGIGVLEKTGFFKSFFTLITKNSKKFNLTFLLILMCLIFSLLGNIGFVVFLPIGALLFKYGKRNPLGGIIASFAALSFGYGINIFLSATDSSLLNLTLNAAHFLDPNYKIGVFFSILIMTILTILIAMIFTNITEKIIMPGLGKYEFEEEEYIVTNKELRGIIVGLGAGILYTLIIIYMIIPGLPLSGGFLDSSASRYIDMVFGENSLFNKGFIFIVTLFLIIIGLCYGFMTKTIKNNKDVSASFAHSLDGIGSILVLIFFASLFISTFNASNIGVVITATLSRLIEASKFNGIGLILLLLIASFISNIFCTGTVLRWKILSGIGVTQFMNASISPEFAQITFSLGSAMATGLTPLFTYFVVYIAFIDKYNQGELTTLFGSLKYMRPYAIAMCIIAFVVIVGWYITGLPLGIGSYPGVGYVS